MFLIVVISPFNPWINVVISASTCCQKWAFILQCSTALLRAHICQLWFWGVKGELFLKWSWAFISKTPVSPHHKPTSEGQILARATSRLWPCGAVAYKIRPTKNTSFKRRNTKKERHGHHLNLNLCETWNSSLQLRAITSSGTHQQRWIYRPAPQPRTYRHRTLRVCMYISPRLEPNP